MQRSFPALFLLSAAFDSPWVLAGPPSGKITQTGGEEKEAQAKAAAETQESVASTTAKFSTVTALDPAVKKALSFKDKAAGMQRVGKKGSFTGTVVNVHDSRHGNLYLNFAQDWKQTLSGHIAAKDFAKFPALNGLKGKRLLLTGTFSAYQGEHPQIDLTSPAQIKIVK